MDQVTTAVEETPLVIEHEDRTVGQGQTQDDGPSELARHKEQRGYTKPAEKAPEPPPMPEAAAPEQPAEPAKKKDERLTDPDTGDVYDMRHKVARRIKSLLDERGMTREEVKRLRAENEEYRRAVLQGRSPIEQPKPETKAQPQGDPEPDPGDTAKYPEGQFDKKFIGDYSRWAARQETNSRFESARTEAKTQAEQAAEAQQVSAWQQTLPEARKRYTDFDEVLGKFENTPDNAPIVKMMMGSPVGNDVVYVLGTQAHQGRPLMEIYKSINAEQRTRMLYHIEAQLLTSLRASQATKPAPTTTKAPPPTSPVQMGPAAGVIDWSRTDDDQQYARYKAMRKQTR